MLPTVILFGHHKDKRIPALLLHMLITRCKVTLLQRGGIYTGGVGAPVFVIDTPRLMLTNKEGCLVILKENRDLKKLAMPPDTTTVFSVEKPLPKKLIQLSPKGIACGGQEGSLGFSSMTEGKSMVALQRCMVNCFGDTVEPMELSLPTTTRTDPYALLATSAALCWLNQI